MMLYPIPRNLSGLLSLASIILKNKKPPIKGVFWELTGTGLGPSSGRAAVSGRHSTTGPEDQTRLVQNAPER